MYTALNSWEKEQDENLIWTEILLRNTLKTPKESLSFLENSLETTVNAYLTFFVDWYVTVFDIYDNILSDRI